MREVLLGLAAPAAASAVIWTVLTRLLSSRAAQRQAASLAFGGGCLLGCALLALTPLRPTSHWHWLPYVLLLAMALGPVSHAVDVSWLERAALYAAAAVVGGLLLAPTWENVTPSRPVQIIVWSSAVVIAAISVGELGRRTNATTYVACLTMAALSGAAVLVLSGNMRLAQELGAGAGALAGLTAALAVGRSDSKLPGMSLPVMVLIGGCLWTGQVNSFSDVPLACYLLPAAAPLALTLLVRGPARRLSDRAVNIARVVLVGVVCGAAVAAAAVFG